MCLAVQSVKIWNPKRDGIGLASTSDFVMDAEVEILCLQAVQSLLYIFFNWTVVQQSKLKENGIKYILLTQGMAWV